MSVQTTFVHMPRSEALSSFIQERSHFLQRRLNRHRVPCDLELRVEGTAKSQGSAIIEFRVAARLANLMGHEIFVSTYGRDIRDTVMAVLDAIEHRVRRTMEFAERGRRRQRRSIKTGLFEPALVEA